MERLRLTETQAKKLADKQSRRTRSRSKWGSSSGGNAKWAVIGMVLGLILVILLAKGGKNTTGSDNFDERDTKSPSLSSSSSLASEAEDIISEPASNTASPTFAPVKETQSPQNTNDEVDSTTTTTIPGGTSSTTTATEPPKPNPTNKEEEEEETSSTTTSPAVSSSSLNITHENIDGSSTWGLNQQQQEEEKVTSTTEQQVRPPEIVLSSSPSSPQSDTPSAAPTEEEIKGGHWIGGGGEDSNNSDKNDNDDNSVHREEPTEPTTTSSSSSSDINNDDENNNNNDNSPPIDEVEEEEEEEEQQQQQPTEADLPICVQHPPVKIIQVCKGTIDAICLEKECRHELNIDLPDVPINENSQQEEDDEEEEEAEGVPSTDNDAASGGGEGTNDDNADDDDKDASPDGDSDQEKEEVLTQTTTVSYQYRRRGRPISSEEAKQLSDKWGQWTLVDPKADERPKEDYCGAYPNRDVPWTDFPPNAWQVDQDYVTDFLREGKALVKRAMEVHLAEYGFGIDDLPGEDFETRRDKSPFLLELIQEGDEEHLLRRRLSTGVNDRAGWAPQKSFDGLVRRLLHAVVSGSDFNLVLGGHSAAAGHGNYFQQSYTLQFQRAIEPVLARLGVKHYARNTGMGGLGTIQSAMGARDIYGSDVDILIWDSSMTEPTKSPDFDLFIRQGILGSDRAPLLWAGIDEPHLLPTLQEHADIDFMMYGTGQGPLPSITDPTTINKIPWAARYMKCNNDFHSLCEDNKYNGTCWIERPDHFDPPTPQNEELGGKASWHDGNRVHQLYGRTMSFTVLTALHEALEFWDKQPQHKLSDDMWHMTDYYENIQSKLANLDPEIGLCYEVDKKNMSTAFCTTTFQSKTEFTPRANPEETSIRSIMKPFGPDATLPQPEENIYEPPDVYNPILGVPEGEVDYLAIIENGVDYTTFNAPKPLPRPTKTGNRLIELTVDDNGEKIVPGLGWGINTKSSPNLCNGTYDSFCGRSADHKCLLYGHNDYRGGLTFDSLSGWGIFTLRNLEKGMIFVKMDSWRKAKDNPVTEGWTEVNNGARGLRSLKSSVEANTDGTQGKNIRRRTKKDANAEFCKDFLLEFAFGDQVVRIKHDEILGERHALVQRVVQIWTVLDDPDFTGGEKVDMELGIRLLGCERQHVFWLSTIYWA